MKLAPPLNGTVEGLKRQLLERRREARQGLATHVVDFEDRPMRVAEEDQAPLFHEEYITQTMNRLDSRTLREVDLALERIARGDYGICPACEEPISIRRLKAIPWARYCLDCQEHRTLDEAGMWEAASESPAPLEPVTG